MTKKITFTIISIVLIFFLASLFSCGSKYGNLKKNTSLKETYSKKSSLPNYNYYYAGTGIPKAIIGIDKEYKLNDRLWFKIENKAEVYNLIGTLDDNPGSGCGNYLYFADIMSSSGEKAGIWFSFFVDTMVEVDPVNKTVVVLNPGATDLEKD